jgi:hypothetical protein
MITKACHRQVHDQILTNVCLKISTNIEKFECMEYICDQIITITKFEILNMYLKSKVVDGILRVFFNGA